MTAEAAVVCTTKQDFDYHSWGTKPASKCSRYEWDAHPFAPIDKITPQAILYSTCWSPREFLSPIEASQGADDNKPIAPGVDLITVRSYATKLNDVKFLIGLDPGRRLTRIHIVPLQDQSTEQFLLGYHRRGI